MKIQAVGPLDIEPESPIPKSNWVVLEIALLCRESVLQDGWKSTPHHTPYSEMGLIYNKDKVTTPQLH